MGKSPAIALPTGRITPFRQAKMLSEWGGERCLGRTRGAEECRNDAPALAQGDVATAMRTVRTDVATAQSLPGVAIL
jgi:hypothetical protein